jgi:hypothetical protein
VAGQARGKFANQEVAVLMEPTLLNHETFGVKEFFEEQSYPLYSYPSGLNCMSVQWVRRDYLQGGGKEASQLVHSRYMDGVEHLNTLAVVFDSPHDVIGLIQKDDENEDDDSPQRSVYEDDDNDYPKLEEWLLSLVAGWRAAWKKTSADRPRIFLILYQAKGLWIKNGSVTIGVEVGGIIGALHPQRRATS